MGDNVEGFRARPENDIITSHFPLARPNRLAPANCHSGLKRRSVFQCEHIEWSLPHCLSICPMGDMQPTDRAAVGLAVPAKVGTVVCIRAGIRLNDVL